METGVPFGTVTCRVTGAGGSGLTSFGSGGAPGASTAGATGAGSVKVGGPAGDGAATAAPSFLATSFRWLSGVGFGLGAGRDAMARAPVGDDVYGEDPTVNLLEDRAAAMFSNERDA